MRFAFTSCNFLLFETKSEKNTIFEMFPISFHKKYRTHVNERILLKVNEENLIHFCDLMKFTSLKENVSLQRSFFFSVFFILDEPLRLNREVCYFQAHNKSEQLHFNLEHNQCAWHYHINNKNRGIVYLVYCEFSCNQKLV